MPPKFDRCVKRVIGQGKSKDSAYAICVAMWKKTHDGQSPFESSETPDLTEYEEFAKTMDLKQMEKEMFNKDFLTFCALKNEYEEIGTEEKQKKREETLDEIKK